jgi:hypothetical protein
VRTLSVVLLACAGLSVLMAERSIVGAVGWWLAAYNLHCCQLYRDREQAVADGVRRAREALERGSSDGNGGQP